MGYLRRITIEHQGFDSVVRKQRGGQAPLRGLTPARMVNLRINIGIKAVFIWRSFFPGATGLTFCKFDLDDGLDTLEPVFPGNNQADRSAMLLG